MAEELRRLPARVAVTLVAAAVVVLAARMAALVLVLAADLVGRAVRLVAAGAGRLVDEMERAEGRLSARAGVLPLGASVTLLPQDGAR